MTWVTFLKAPDNGKKCFLTAGSGNETHQVWDPRGDDRARVADGGARTNGRSSDRCWEELRGVDVDDSKRAGHATFANQAGHLQWKTNKWTRKSIFKLD